MLKKSLIAMGLAAPLMLSQPVMARDFGSIYTDCGLGGLIGAQVEDSSTGNILAIVTNVTWDLGTTAVISDVSSPDSCAGGSGAVAAFIHQSYDALEQDLASGQGQHLDTLKSLSGAGEGFEQDLRSAFTAEVASVDYSSQTHYEKSEALYNLVYKVN